MFRWQAPSNSLRYGKFLRTIVTNDIKMKTNAIFQISNGRGYESPSIEVVDAVVERGYSMSGYGDEGAAGGDFGWGGDYEL